MLVNIHAAKTHFSRLVQRAAAGEEIVIARAGVPVAKLVPYPEERAAPQRLGFWKGRVQMAEDWDSDAVNGAIERTFDGGADT